MPAIVSSSPRVSVWEWAQTILLAIDLIWTTLCLGGYPPRIMVLTSALTAVLVAVHFAGRAFDKTSASATHPAGCWLLPFLIYAAANVVWVTPVRWLGWLEWLGWAQMIAIFWVVLNGIRSPVPRRILFLILIALGIVGVLLGCYQRFERGNWAMLGWVRGPEFWERASGSFGIPNSFAGFLLLLLPIAGALTFRRGASAGQRIWWGWVAGVLAFGLVLTISRGAWFSLAIALTIWPLAAARGSGWRRVGFALLAVLLTLLAGTVIYSKSPKVRERFTQLVLNAGEKTRPVMWRGAWQLFRDKPLLGTGAASYNVMFEKYRPDGFRDEPKWAHNEFLNTLSDYGALGFVLFFGPCFAIGACCVFRRKHDAKRSRAEWLDSRETTGAIGIGLLAFTLQLGVDFHFKIPALAMAAATLAGLAVGRAMPSDARPITPTPFSRSVAVGLAAAWLVAVMMFFTPKLRAEAFRVGARQSIDRLSRVTVTHPDFRHSIPHALAALNRATTLDLANGQAWADLSYTTSLSVYLEPVRMIALGKNAEAYAERALACAPICSEFWVRRGVARDAQGRWSDAGNDFAKAVELAPADSTTWYYYADHLSRHPLGREAAEAAVEFCLRLDPGNSAGVALRQRLAIRSEAP